MIASPPPPARPGATSNLVVRTATALVLAPLALAVLYAGGWWWAALVIAASSGLYAEWLSVVGALERRLSLALGVAALVAAGGLAAAGLTTEAAAAIAGGLIALSLTGQDRGGWIGAGFAYASVAALASLLVRRDGDFGFAALMLVLLVVWASDIGGYVAGRLIGGPKLWPRVSPKKTWAGALGGFAGSVAVGAAFAAAGQGRLAPLMLLAGALAVASQLGDLFESAVKRRFGVKDSSQIIPGHGGLLDRLDGYVAAIAAAAVVGLARGGLDGVGRGLMVW